VSDISTRNISLRTSIAAVGKDNIDPSQYGDFFEYSVGETSVEISAKSEVSLLTLPKLTLSQAGSKFYSPVSGEKSIGTFHPLGRATPSAPDATTTTATTTSPATLDLSSLVPVGTTWVELAIEIAQITASEVQHNNGNAWDYDFGAHNGYNTFTKGLSAVRACRPAMVSAGYVLARAFGKVNIGTSRKL